MEFIPMGCYFSWEHLKYQNSHPGADFRTSLRRLWGVGICCPTNIQLEALRERRPPWPRQIITPILPTVKMLSLGCERLPTPLKKKKKKKKRFWIITFTTIWVCYHYFAVFLLIYSSYNTQITTKI